MVADELQARLVVLLSVVWSLKGADGQAVCRKLGTALLLSHVHRSRARSEFGDELAFSFHGPLLASKMDYSTILMENPIFEATQACSANKFA